MFLYETTQRKTKNKTGKSSSQHFLLLSNTFSINFYEFLQNFYKNLDFADKK